MVICSLHHDDVSPHSRQECPARELSQWTGKRKQVLQVSETEAQIPKGISAVSPCTHSPLKFSKSLASCRWIGWVFKLCRWLTSEQTLCSLNAEVNVSINSGWDPCLCPDLAFRLDQILISKARAWVSPSYWSSEVSNHGAVCSLAMYTSWFVDSGMAPTGDLVGLHWTVQLRGQICNN